MAKWDYAVTKVSEYFGQVVADSEKEATNRVKDELEFRGASDTEDVILNLYRVDDE